MDTLTLESYAKLNLFLQVVDKRKDTYHTLITLFERISLSDTIRLTRRTDSRIVVRTTSSKVPGGRKNLAWKSADALRRKTGVRFGCDILIDKRIPAGAGMGGGSSNAATVLCGLNRLWGLGLNREELVQIARTIGADVPFFVHDVPFALAEGVGDKILPVKALKRSNLWHVVAVPRLHVPTPYIYQQWDVLAPNVLKKQRLGLTIPKNDVKLIISAIKNKLDLEITGKRLFNALQFVTQQCFPSVGRIVGRLKRMGLPAVLMSGSGPTVFALVSTKKQAESIARQLTSDSPRLQVFVVKTR